MSDTEKNIAHFEHFRQLQLGVWAVLLFITDETKCHSCQVSSIVSVPTTNKVIVPAPVLS